MKMKPKFIPLLAVIFLAACSNDMLSIFFDVPPPTAEELAQERAKAAARLRAEQNKVVVDEPVSIKLPPHKLAGKLAAAKSWDEAKKYLPMRADGQADWMVAMDRNIIQPRTHIGTDRASKAVFGYDFFIRGNTPLFDAWFPHSSHTRLLNCDSCHPKVFKYRGSKITMNDIRAGRYCGTCHGKMAFSVDTSCSRCHVAMPGGKK